MNGRPSNTDAPSHSASVVVRVPVIKEPSTGHQRAIKESSKSHQGAVKVSTGHLARDAHIQCPVVDVDQLVHIFVVEHQLVGEGHDGNG